MTSWIWNKWVIGGMACLLLLNFPVEAFPQKATLRDIQVKGPSGDWKVSFVMENCFPEKVEEAIQAGTPTTFTFYLQLYLVKNWWGDRRLVSLRFQHTIQYHPIRGEYQVTLDEQETPRVTQDFEEAKAWMTRVQDVGIRPPASEMNRDAVTYLRIRAELELVRLPLHLEYLLPFMSFWNLKTDWYVEPLYP